MTQLLQTAISPRSLTQAALGLLCLVAVPFASYSLPASIVVALVSVVVVVLALTNPDRGSGVAICCALVAVGLLATFGLPVVGWAIPLIIYALIVRRVPALGLPSGWAARGRPALGWIPAFVIVPAVALWLWVTLFDPDLSEHLALLPDLPLPLLLAGGLLFAMSNAAAEEAIFRGVIQGGLDPVFSSPWMPVVIQAMAFGLCHFRGFPSGVAGMCMALAYGFALGILRRKSGGLLAPWIAHVAADTTIFALLLMAR